MTIPSGFPANSKVGQGLLLLSGAVNPPSPLGMGSGPAIEPYTTKGEAIPPKPPACILVVPPRGLGGRRPPREPCVQCAEDRAAFREVTQAYSALQAELAAVQGSALIWAGMGIAKSSQVTWEPGRSHGD